MQTQIDEKGKIFTPFITKKPVAVIIQIGTHLIRGDIHIRPDDRVKDALRRSDDFLAVTDAVVYDHQNRPLYHTKFMALNYEQIVWLIPNEDLTEQPNLEQAS